MAHPDRQLGGPEGTPDKFKRVMSALFEADPDGMQSLHVLGAELNTIRGPLAKEIAKWRISGLGRVIAIPVPEISRDFVEGGQYRSMAYALPYTDETVTGHDRRIVMLFASDDGPHRVNILGPRKSIHPVEDIQTIENENFLSEFDLLFRPSDKPSILTNWMPEEGESPHTSFIKNIVLFPAMNHTLKDIDSEAAYRKGVLIAQRMQVQRMKIDESALKEQLDLGSDFTALSDIVTLDWEQLKGNENWRARGKLLGDEDNPDQLETT
jgi:hypothetical protein